MKTIKEQYRKEIIPKMKEKLGYKNVMAIPKIEKVTLNVGLGKSLTNKEYVKVVENTLTRISGQKPVFTEAKKSISAFKIREGMVVGAKVTLRGKKMDDFLTKLVHITFPRMKDFHGIDALHNHIDQNGNFSFGLKEHTVFPEIKSDEVEHVHGLELTITTTSKNKAECYFLLKYLGFPFIVDEDLEKELKDNNFKNN
jgi:large subunit ribosomal protein L5